MKLPMKEGLIVTRNLTSCRTFMLKRNVVPICIFEIFDGSVLFVFDFCLQ